MHACLQAPQELSQLRSPCRPVRCEILSRVGAVKRCRSLSLSLLCLSFCRRRSLARSCGVQTGNVELVFSCFTSVSSSTDMLRCGIAPSYRNCSWVLRLGRRVLDNLCRHSGGHCGGSCGGSREYQSTADRCGMFPDAGTHVISRTTSERKAAVTGAVPVTHLHKNKE